MSERWVIQGTNTNANLTAGRLMVTDVGGGAGVTSVFGRTGVVVATASDYSTIYTKQSNNLSDLNSTATARTNIGADNANWNANKISDIDVSGTAPTAGQILKYNATATKYEPSADSGGSADFSNGGDTAGAARTLGNTDNYSLGLLTNNVDRLSILNSGNVGINATAPDSLLTLAQKADANGIKVYGYDDKSAVYGQMHINASGSFVVNGSANVVYQSTGYQFFLSSDNIYMNIGSAKDLVIRDSSSAPLVNVKESTGDVGIGTASPTEKLEVVGNVKASGYIDLAETSGTAAPAANTGRIYVADTSGTTALYFKDATTPAKNLLNMRDVAGTELKIERFSIGDWNMDTTGDVTITTNVARDDVYSVAVLIRDDTDTYTFQLVDGIGMTVNGSYEIFANSVKIYRKSGGQFDNTDFDSTSYNRGYITIMYK